ncbi:helix-turn-helix transcriptional regulator [Sinorhizobium alkalisoli]|uniref:Helix-turn-helix transcriptional regulator n=1 Tax=Sinorhizobium alkalisoli TaxID=1752398 RepID=A0A1E3V9Z2_9HYPH|nr:response regulator transcription factor [Sinorhizobium alkalisoli]MCA1491888.1 response regulator transcription factor [Ensifer sp. NBAIM29]MCG5478727.1 response regulator transcription factor [Sinorhizobium alkalisoli]ODR90443.1 helix-turn-helix transcriptional regulator [Sinorhizobium alkalisoli]QFI67769.1 Transcriptional regulator, LuxR family [Sinorhizobium alkalisoli]
MYRTGSSLSEFEDNNRVLAKKAKIVMLARADLLAECLTQAISTRFQGNEVVSLSEADSLLDGNLDDVALIMLYRLPASTFPSVIRTIHEFHPRASIGLVVENADEVDSSIAGFVDEGLIHGVLPLNLHLDVCLTAIDLLMKGGEHFPAALLRRLAPRSETGSATPAQREACAEAMPPAQRSDVGRGLLTSREVQILDLICMGTQNKIIADRLGLSENTVKVHVRNIYKKMNVRNRTEAASRYFRHDGDAGPPRWRN